MELYGNLTNLFIYSRVRLFTVPYFSVRLEMSIVESDGPPSWSLDASETGESTKCPWVGVVEGTGGEKNRETLTASLCLVFNGRGRVLAPP